MRQTMTAVLERDGLAGPTYSTEPYECAWAGEARWFVRTLDLPTGVESIELQAQVSPDGLHWCDLTGSSMTVDGTGVATFASSDFGGWLRLRATVNGENPSAFATALIYLVLKS